MSHSLQPHGLQYARLPWLASSPRAWSNWCPLSQWCHPTISSSVVPYEEIKPVNPKGNQSWLLTGRTDPEAPILWPPDTKSWLIRKYSGAGKDWRQEEKCRTEFFIWLQSKINHVTLDMSFGLFASKSFTSDCKCDYEFFNVHSSSVYLRICKYLIIQQILNAKGKHSR